ncbi:uncharacterized protein H6S33_002404 [Morchella sextelata]|uniref:uncharacterized protein n=1 Tax=Morchella sextelata TaxID=1174677 RepID=UPI001D041072|nr:uncharacterized protein H6S33_002404 [Morchella sextelata]KAH0607370.1 hypothetical protein H6S33_002404 [Morchella sextelata]
MGKSYIAILERSGLGMVGKLRGFALLTCCNRERDTRWVEEQESFEHIRYLLPPEPGILTLRETGGVGQAEKGGWVPTWRDEWMDGWMGGGRRSEMQRIVEKVPVAVAVAVSVRCIRVSVLLPLALPLARGH